MITYVQNSVYPISIIVVIRSAVERRRAYTRNAIGDYDARKATAIRERMIDYTRYAVRDSDARKATAISERIIANARYAVRDSDARKVLTIIERPIANARNTPVGWNNTVFASGYKSL